MKNLKALKISDLVKEEFRIEELSKIMGGTLSPIEGEVQTDDGCYSGICSVQINPSYCSGGAVCTSGIAGKSNRIES